MTPGVKMQITFSIVAYIQSREAGGGVGWRKFFNQITERHVWIAVETNVK